MSTRDTTIIGIQEGILLYILCSFLSLIVMYFILEIVLHNQSTIKLFLFFFLSFCQVWFTLEVKVYKIGLEICRLVEQPWL